MHQTADLEVDIADTYRQSAWVQNKITRKGAKHGRVEDANVQPVGLSGLNENRLLLAPGILDFGLCQMIEALKQSDGIGTALVGPVQPFGQRWVGLAHDIQKGRLNLVTRPRCYLSRLNSVKPQEKGKQFSSIRRCGFRMSMRC